MTTYTGLSPELARSWWLLSATSDNTGRMAGTRADVAVIDLEDGVAPQRKAFARTVARGILEQGPAWIRINDVRSPYWRDDVEALGELSQLSGVMIAKVDSATDIELVSAALPAPVPLVAFIETAVALEAAREIADHPRVCRLALGSGDLRMDLGAEPGSAILDYARSRLVVASRAAGLPGPIDGPSIVNDEGLVQRETASARSLGMTGRLCLDPAHAALINTVLSPTVDDIAAARATIAQLGSDGANATKGSDIPRLRRAHRTIDLASRFDLI
ncbi:HpcH/HpaI aldolase/citrate lyase family protein [Nocardia terrae]|nr:aldolase/citrate lyase family protein [Nocardia terrae]